MRVDVVYRIGRSALVCYFLAFLMALLTFALLTAFLTFLFAFAFLTAFLTFLLAFAFLIAIVVSSWSERQPTFRPRDEFSLSI